MKCQLATAFLLLCLHITISPVFSAPTELTAEPKPAGNGTNVLTQTLEAIPYPDNPTLIESKSFQSVNSLEGNGKNEQAENTVLPPASTSSTSPPEVEIKQRNIGQAPVAKATPHFTPDIAELTCKHNLATLRWTFPQDSPAQPTKYIIQYSENKSDVWETVKFRVYNTETSVRNLYPNIAYRFRVIAVLPDNRQSESKIHSCKTDKDFPTRNPTIISAYRKGDNEVLVRWRPLENREKGSSGRIIYKVYILRLRDDDFREQLYDKTVADGSEYRFENVRLPAGRIVALVTSVNELGASRAEENVVDISTESVPEMAPQIVKVDVIDANNATVVFHSVPSTSVNGNFEAYVLRFYNQDGEIALEFFYNKNDTINKFDVNSLQPDREYQLTVSVKNGQSQYGPETARFPFRTKKDKLPYKADFVQSKKCDGWYEGGGIVYHRSIVIEFVSKDSSDGIQHNLQYCLMDKDFKGSNEQCFIEENYGQNAIVQNNPVQKIAIGENDLNKILFVRVASSRGDASVYSDIIRVENNEQSWKYVCETTVTTTTTTEPTTTTTPKDKDPGNNNQNPGIIYVPGDESGQTKEPTESDNTVWIVAGSVGLFLVLVLMGFIAYRMVSRPPKLPANVKLSTTVEQQKPENQALNRPSNDDEDDERASPYPTNQ